MRSNTLSQFDAPKQLVGRLRDWRAYIRYKPHDWTSLLTQGRVEGATAFAMHGTCHPSCTSSFRAN